MSAHDHSFLIPEYVIPDYQGACLSSLIPALLGPQGTRELPSWFPVEARDARAVVMLVLDGLGYLQWKDHQQHLPTLSSCAVVPLTTVAPSTTATALTSLTTGLPPGEHGLIGYRIDMGTTVMNTLRWGDESGDLRWQFPPQQVQSCPPFLGTSVPVISRAELEGSGFTQAHLAGVRQKGWRAASSIAVTVAECISAGDSFVYAYYDGIDKIAHERGFGSYYESELRSADALVADVLSVLPPDTVLLVTADHGQVMVGENTLFVDQAVREHIHHQSGEGRFRWLHAKRGREEALLKAARVHDDIAWVVSRDQVIDEKWFGARVSKEVMRRMGDVALVPHAPVSFEDSADTGAFPLVCRHGSLTEAEMRIPLFARRQ
jgi:predicted AlkP superfamily pyrophosphatase or phosphodiesterase